MRVLVTNDDGVRAPGIAALAIALEQAGFDIVVVAPLDDRSGSGAAFGPVHMGEGVDYEESPIEGLAASAYGIDGPPALAVMAARLGAFGPPVDLVASGINPGPNTGRSVLHSGTVGAALTGANFGVSAVAISIGAGEPYHWQTAGALAVSAVRWVIDQEERTVVNLNVPNVRPDELLGVRPARLAPFGTVRTAIAGSAGGRLQMELRATEVELSPDTDTALVNAGWAAVTSLVGIRSAGEEASAAAADALEGWTGGA